MTIRSVAAVAILSLVATTGAFASKEGMHCSLTNKNVEKGCCCTKKDGKLYCTLAKKHIDSCCCKPGPAPTTKATSK